METKVKYYDGKNLIKLKADYNLVIGERSNGKTHYFLEYALRHFKKTGQKFCYIRRWAKEFQGSNSARSVFDTLIHPNGDNLISKIFGDKYIGIEYYGGKYYLCVEDDGKRKRTLEFVGYGLVLANQEDYKSTSYNDTNIIIFDEFITRGTYIFNEFIAYTNLLSTIIRDRGNVEIYMLANTVSQYGCPYFNEMRLKNITKQKQGTIDLYHYENSELTVAVEYCANNNKSKKSNKYFAFDNPQLKMITEGAWEIASYPHTPCKYKPSNVIKRIFLEYEENTLECEIVVTDDGDIFGVWHRKTTDIKDDNATILTLDKMVYKNNYINNLKTNNTRMANKIKQLFRLNKMYYVDNLIGEIVFSYLCACSVDK